jgi:hypothetical protein
VVCLRDFIRLKQHLDHLCQEPEKKKEALDTLMACLAILQGANQVGLDVADEEKGLEEILNNLEKR